MPRPSRQSCFCTKGDGYRGIWWGQSPFLDDYGYKYSGGLATYPVQHSPFALYRPEVKKTFFVWGGTTRESLARIGDRGSRWDFGPGELLHMISYYDHVTGLVPRPTVIFDKWTADPHDNPVLTIDDDGFIWVFSPSHGRWTTPSFVHRSLAPYDISRFETVEEGLFAYPQLRWMAGRGLSMFFTDYAGSAAACKGRSISFRFSPDGRTWGESRLIAHMMQGHYQTSETVDGRVATAFDLHPEEGGLDARTNLYYVESRDLGRTWTTAAGEPVDLPVTSVRHPCLVRDYQAEGLLVYIKDLAFDPKGYPVIHYVVSRGWRPGPQNGPHQWRIARWTGSEWAFHLILESDNNYDMGSLYLERDDLWRIAGSAAPGPQRFNPGGEIEYWISNDQGATWRCERVLTRQSVRNHTHLRRPLDAHPEFYAFWADGDTRQPSESHLYFSNRAGDAVWRLPPVMEDEFARPERVFVSGQA